MGQSPSTESTVSELLDAYTWLSPQGNPHLSFLHPSIRILEEKQTFATFAYKQQTFLRKQEYDYQWKMLANANNHCENVIQLIKIWTRQHNGICSNIYKIYTIYEYPPVRLQDEIDARSQVNKLFQEYELFSIMQSCMEAIKHHHYAISPSKIFIVADGLLKIVHTHLLSNIHRVTYDHDYYYAPQKISNWNKESSNWDTPENQAQEAIFSMAMTVLGCGCLKRLSNCYLLKEARIDMEAVRKHLLLIKKAYSPAICTMLTSILLGGETTMEIIQNGINEFFLQKSISSSTIEENNFNHVHIESRNASPTLKNCPVIKSIEHHRDNVDNSYNSVYLNGVQHRNAESHLHPTTLTQYNSTFSTELQTKRNTMPKIVANVTNEHLPKSPSILAFSKNGKKSKENIYTDPKLLELIQNEMGNSKKRKEEKTERVHRPSEENKCVFVTESYPDGTKFQGMLCKQIRNGYGKLTYEDGAYYEGIFKDGIIQGRGTLYYEKDRPAYVGDWVNEEFHGKGTLFSEFSETLQTEFDWRDFNKVGPYWLKYEGQFQKDHKHGEGVLLLTNGETIHGTFQHDQLNGKAIFTNVFGQKICGQWRNNVFLREQPST